MVPNQPCDECKKRPATVHLTRIINGNKSEAHLCQTCAQERGDAGFMPEPGFTFHNILSGLFESEGAVAGPKPSAPRTRARCPNCGSSFADFRRLGHLGCSECYAQFERELEPVLRRIHGTTKHVGKAPKGLAGQYQLRRELEALRGELQMAIAREEYERAAQLRDKIRQLESDLA